MPNGDKKPKEPTFREPIWDEFLEWFHKNYGEEATPPVSRGSPEYREFWEQRQEIKRQERVVPRSTPWDTIKERYGQRYSPEFWSWLEEESPAGFERGWGVRGELAPTTTPKISETPVQREFRENVEEYLRRASETFIGEAEAIPPEEVAPEEDFESRLINTLTQRQRILSGDSSARLSEQQLTDVQTFISQLRSFRDTMNPEMPLQEYIATPEAQGLVDEIGFPASLENIIDEGRLETALTQMGREQELSDWTKSIRGAVKSAVGELPPQIMPFVTNVVERELKQRMRTQAPGAERLEGEQFLDIPTKEIILAGLSPEEFSDIVEQAIYIAEQERALGLVPGQLNTASQAAGFKTKREYLQSFLPERTEDMTDEEWHRLTFQAMRGRVPTETERQSGILREASEKATRAYLETERGGRPQEIIAAEEAMQAARGEERQFAGEGGYESRRKRMSPSQWAAFQRESLSELDRMLVSRYPKANIGLARRQFGSLFGRWQSVQDKTWGEFLGDLGPDYFEAFITHPVTETRPSLARRGGAQLRIR